MRTLILLFFYVIIVVLAIPVFIFCYIVKRPNLLLFLGKAAMGLSKIILGIQLEVQGLEHVDRKKQYVFMANHLSFIDGPLLFLLIPQQIRVIIKIGIVRIPIVGPIMKYAGFVPVDRKGIKSGRKSIDYASKLIKEKGYSFLIFPEGTRSRDGKLHEFRRGGFFLALNSQTPIVPITIKGTYDLMPKGSFFIKRGKIFVIFHEPVSVKGFEQQNLPELVTNVRNVIKSGLSD
ncbi:MAG: 1-acyl-sn-glycerol-3-phosphate acyltransferase [Candidatus Aminicenantes bacterium]|nr:1-acyl-sn-glycerol-3-phosphate acyltransferase [Candidatus Aminicenantes bacterium]